MKKGKIAAILAGVTVGALTLIYTKPTKLLKRKDSNEVVSNKKSTDHLFV